MILGLNIAILVACVLILLFAVAACLACANVAHSMSELNRTLAERAEKLDREKKANG